MSNTKYDNSFMPPVNIIPIGVLYQLILLLGYSILLGGFKIGDEVLDVSYVDAKLSECISSGDLILYEIYKL